MAANGTKARRRRVQLDAATIVDAGLRLAAAGGQDAVSFRKLGAELGVDPTAVYRHFRDKDDLVAAMLDRLFEAVAENVDDVLPWLDRLMRLADECVAVMSAHPAVGVEAGSTSTQGPAELQLMEFVLAAFVEAGLQGDDLMRFYGAYTSYVLAFASAMAAGRLAQGEAWAADDHWVPALGRVDADAYPNVTDQADGLEQLRTGEVFTTTLTVILTAAAAAASTRSTRTSSRGRGRRVRPTGMHAD